jgi:hypothetical protein
MPFGKKEIYFLSVFRQGKHLALYTKSARGWYLTTLCFDSKNIYLHIFYIVYPCSPCLVHQTSAYLHNANQPTETVSGRLPIAFVDREASCPDKTHAQTGSRRHAGGLPQSCA